MNKTLDSILDLMASLDITIDHLQARSSELGLQLQGDSNKNEINNKNNHSETEFDPVATVVLQDQMPATAAQAVALAKKSRESLAKVSSARLWQDFVAFNRLKGRKGLIHLKAFLGFLRVWENRLDRVQEPVKTKAPKAEPLEITHEAETLVRESVEAAPPKNKAFHESDLIRKWSAAHYHTRIRETSSQYGISLSLAKLVVHGQAVKSGELQA